ncbi:MAG: hypothetical protein D6721_02735 [Gammaproteobacteria bacterium]|nr:MAG: hypothetical protein D6721_02735 [Gammaproteobacteria bacterium]
MAVADLGTRFRRSAVWAYAQGWLSAMVSFAGGIVMARLLEPRDFGLFAAVSAYTLLIGRQLQMGVPEALLRTPEDDMEAIHSGYWSMQALSVLCALVAAGLAPVLAHVYADPRYRDVMWALALLFLLQPACLAAQAELRRAMRHDLVSRITLVSALAGTGSSILAAASGLGVYAFVVGGLVSSLVLVGGSVWRSRWRPALRFRGSRARGLLGYGWRVHAANSLELAADRVDAMLIGRWVGMDLLGIYRRADSTAKLPVLELLGRLYSLIIALFARLEGDPDRTRTTFRKLSTSVLVPICLALAWLWHAMAAFIGFLYGEKWLPAVPYARILVFAALLMSLRGLLAMYLNAAGHAGKQAGIGLFDLVLTAGLLALGLHWGLTGVAWAVVGRYLVLLLVTLLVVRRYAEIRVADYFSSVWPPVLVMAGVMLLLALVAPERWLPAWAAYRPVVLAVDGLFAALACFLLLVLLHRVHPGHAGLAALFELLGRLRERVLGRLRAGPAVPEGRQ